MPERVQFPPDIEPLVRFIEETPPSAIVDQALAKLRDGISTRTMLTASALAVTRSADLPPGHHGGPLHPLAGLYALSKLVDRREGEDRFLPVLQHVALANKHINDPVTAPFSLLDFAPMDADGVQVSRLADLAADGAGDQADDGEAVAATKAAFLKACSRGESNKADHLFLWLWDHVPAIEAFDLLLSVALPKNALDDHYFLFPGYLWRGMDIIGREHLKVLMRPAVRYVARFPEQRSVPEVDAIIEKYDLLGRVMRQRTGDDETAKIGEIGEAIRNCSAYSEIPELLGKALSEGLSLEGAGEALSIGAAGLFLRSLTGNPMDVHLHTSANLRRYLLRLEGLSPKSKLLSLLLWHTGPEIKSTQYPHDARAAARCRRRGRATAALAGRIARGHHLQHRAPAADRLVHGHQPGPHARGARGARDGEPGAAIRRLPLRPRGADAPPGGYRLPRQLHRDARVQAPPGDCGGVPQHAGAVALDASGVRLPGSSDLVRQEHGNVRRGAGSPARGVNEQEGGEAVPPHTPLSHPPATSPCHCERSEAISRRVRTSLAGDCFAALVTTAS